LERGSTRDYTPEEGTAAIHRAELFSVVAEATEGLKGLLSSWGIVPRPNLFSFATSELSQDAFLSWLLAWADEGNAKANPGLHDVAVTFVESLFRAEGTELPTDPITVEVDTQVRGADVVALINEGKALIIEDKVHTTHHSDQLQRYREKLGTEYEDRELVCVYLKTGDQSSYAKVRDRGWATFNRADLLQILETGQENVDNAIFLDFLAHLQTLEAEVNRWQTAPLSDWESKDDAWKGLYKAIQEDRNGKWHYVANPRGGFFAFHWAWTTVEGGSVYLQLEEDNLVAKVKVPDEGQRKSLRDSWSKKLRNTEGPLSFERPDRFGHGKHMTIAEAGEYRVPDEAETVDLSATLDVLEDATRTLEAVVDSE
jgi:hypothetical protein